MTERELLLGYGLITYHCSRIQQEGAIRWPCAELAAVVYRLPDGSLAGWCDDHRPEADRHAALRGWVPVEATVRTAVRAVA